MTEKIKTRIRKEGTERVSSQPSSQDEVPTGPYGMFNFTEMFKSLNIPENAQNQQVYENQQLMTDIGKFFFTSMMNFSHLINTHKNTGNKTSINSADRQIKVEQSRARNSKSSRNARNARSAENQPVSETTTGGTDGIGSGHYRKQSKNKQTRQSNNAAQTTNTTNERFNTRSGTGKGNRGRVSHERGVNSTQLPESQTRLTTDRERTPAESERQYSVKESLPLDRVPTHRDAGNDLVVSEENKVTAREEGEYDLSTECEHPEANFSDFQAPTPNNNDKQKLNLNIYRFINNCVSIKESTTTDTMIERAEALSTARSTSDGQEEGVATEVHYGNQHKAGTVTSGRGVTNVASSPNNLNTIVSGNTLTNTVANMSSTSDRNLVGNTASNVAGDIANNFGVDTGDSALNNSPAYSGANPSGTGGGTGGTDEETLLMLCFGGDLEGVKKLREVDLEFVDEVGRSAIHYACTSGNVDLVSYLITRDVEIDKKDVKGWTPLFISVVKNYVDIVELLLDCGADLTLTLRHRCAPTRLTDAHSHPIHFAAIKLNREMTELLLSRNVDVNQKDSQGITPLSYSCTKGDLEYVAYLLDAGANPTIQDVNGRTSYHSVALGGSLELAKLLHERVGIQNTQDRWSLTPAKLAHIRGHTELSEFLAHPSRHAPCGRELFRGGEQEGVIGDLGTMSGGNPLPLDAVSVNSDDSDDMYVLVSTTIASALNEPNSDQIYRCLTRLGPDVVKTLFELTLKVEKNGGVATADGKRLRTPGGVFFTLLKQMYLNDYITKEDYQYIRAAEKERIKSLKSTKANVNVTTATNAANKHNNAGNKYNKAGGNNKHGGTSTKKTNVSNKYRSNTSTSTRYATKNNDNNDVGRVGVSNNRRGTSGMSKDGRRSAPRTNDQGNRGNSVDSNNRVGNSVSGRSTGARNNVSSVNTRARSNKRQ
ncbi:ankyrin repeat containing protein [Theileria orientalis]|uniref:Ankyrin repeat containing protein n=1 Tax=Theileria orientalis TaxID=68886 RepID=A0A976M616_THEOR|nr:ankyrin repeat containing protein [Theileria orientalis]